MASARASGMAQEHSGGSGAITLPGTPEKLPGGPDFKPSKG